jgi:nitronate monooxygenase
MDRWPTTRVAQRLNVELPIVQGPLNGLNTQKLTAAVSNRGGLGSFGAHGLAPNAIAEAIAQIRTLTAKPFAVNLWVSMDDLDGKGSDEAAFHRGLQSISGSIRSLGGVPPVYQPYRGLRFEDQVRAVVDQKVPVFSFICGIPPKEILQECRRQRIILMGTATTVDEARALEESDVDLIVASGQEAGGHRGSFLRRAEESLVGTFALVPQVADAVSLPVIAAGGIADARGLLAVLALGAEGALLGTAFVASPLSGASAAYRAALLERHAAHTALTRNFTGRVARGIDNDLMRLLNRPDIEALPYPLQRQLVRHLTDAAQKAGNSDLAIYWAGQSADLIRTDDALALIDELVSAVEGPADAVLAFARARRGR